ncbi:hypothetical protein GWO43_18345 [candidate division KSB1 bacterium]|nr:hypothetical protein [candidate division KSB1 bacterium]NIR69567.1 hypothetical protein [candidate division KSB1 bacterium]NIS25915.1 hypothetical protein [candidate division KSB1 bacterium]NIT72796.1 hypothetical protein [candidate division KSB1 bacterium]NIU26603.1 hypothetical protein [candidate division KSB1 bacterium]
MIKVILYTELISLLLVSVGAVSAQQLTSSRFDGSWPGGLRIGVDGTGYYIGEEFGIGSAGFLFGPSLHLTLLSDSGPGVDFVASYLKEDANFTFNGGAAMIGFLYHFPQSFLVPKIGYAFYRGEDSDGGNPQGDGFFVGAATILRVHGRFGMRVDVTGNYWRNGAARNDGSLGFTVGLGIALIPKSSR